MDYIQIIESRFHFRLPDDYLRFWNAGVLVNDPEFGLNLSRFSWLSPQEIADCSWPSYKIDGLVPCAETPGRDHYAWYVQPGAPAWVADCPRDSRYGEGVAPHFEGFVFRSLLDEFSDSWLIDDTDEIVRIYRQYMTRVRALFRKRWIEILLAFESRKATLNGEGRPQLIPPEEVKNIVHAELAFPMLGREIVQHKD